MFNDYAASFLSSGLNLYCYAQTMKSLAQSRPPYLPDLCSDLSKETQCAGAIFNLDQKFRSQNCLF